MTRPTSKGWWDGMDLSAWCVEGTQGSGDFGFALAIANERARRRGVRQRVARNRGETLDVFAFVIVDVRQPRLRAVAS